MLIAPLYVLIFFFKFSKVQSSGNMTSSWRHCDDLLPGQYICQIFQQPPKDCNNEYQVPCTLAVGLKCLLSSPSLELADQHASVNNGKYVSRDLEDIKNHNPGIVSQFNETISCPYNATGYRFDLALLLSVLFGVIGVDRFYLGYPALGVLKMFSFGGLLIWWLVDIVLIALQILKPVDNSDYELSLNAARMIKIDFTAFDLKQLTHDEF